MSTEAPFFHVGILVEDMHDAIARFGEVLGLDFATPPRSLIPQLDEGGEVRDWEVYVSYSRQGPPHFELIEAAGDGIFGAQQGYGFHHLGAWIEDAPAFAQRLGQIDVGVEASMRNGDISLGDYFSADDLGGIRFESCPTLIRPGWQDWVTGRVTDLGVAATTTGEAR